MTRRPPPPISLSGIARKRFAQRAQSLQLSQLADARANAEKWRNGLLGLTGLLTAVAILKGRDATTGLTSTGRLWVVALLAGALLSLLTGSFLAMRASFGAPDHTLLLTAENLAGWEKQETGHVTVLLLWSRVLSAAGILTLAAATGITYVNSPKRKPPAFLFVRVQSEAVCGELLSGNGGLLRLRTTNKSGHDQVREIRLTAAESIQIVADCSK